MLEILLTILFVWLLFKVIGLAFRVAWGAAKIVASILFTLAVPLLVLCLIFAGGMLILIPLAILGAAFDLEQTMARGIFDAAIEYAARGYHL